MKKAEYRECPTLEVLDPVCQRSIYPPVDEYVKEATALALCGVKPSKTRERSHEWLEVVRGQTYRQPGVLINNWFEEGQDIVDLKREKCILSDLDVNYETTYRKSYGDIRGVRTVQTELKHLKYRFSHAFPRHQPELDSAYMKAKCNSWESTNEAAYVDPRLQRNPALLANVDEALDRQLGSDVVDTSWMLKCWNCNVRPREPVHPSIVEAQRCDQPASDSS